MVNKKLIALVTACALAACLALVGCGGGQANTNKDASNQQQSTQSTTSNTSNNSGQSGQNTSSSSTNTNNSNAAPSAPATSNNSAATPSAPATSNNYIGEERAKEIALADAGLTANDVTELKVSLDQDNGTIHYDVDFKNGGKEYDYDIEPTTGAIIKVNSEVDD